MAGYNAPLYGCCEAAAGKGTSLVSTLKRFPPWVIKESGTRSSVDRAPVF
jgi:hypothetical protein